MVCPLTFGKKCPICEYRKTLLDDGADWKDETVKALRPSKRNLYVVIPIDNADYEEVPHVWDISDFCFQQLLKEELDINPENEVFPDLDDGLTLRIRFTKESFGKNDFAKASRIDFEERSEAYDEKILDEVPDLDKILVCYSYSELKAKFLEIDDVDEDSDDETMKEKPERKTKTIRSHRKPKKEVEEETETEPEQEEEPKKRPTRRVVRKARKEPEQKEEQKEENRCPYGHRFGVDCESEEAIDDCLNCTLWEECIEAKDG